MPYRDRRERRHERSAITTLAWNNSLRVLFTDGEVTVEKGLRIKARRMRVKKRVGRPVRIAIRRE